jgi:hypothetical protein
VADRFTGSSVADRIGTPKTSGKADHPLSPETLSAQPR